MEEQNGFESNEAKRQRLMGVKNDEKIHSEDVQIKKGNFFSNLWYRHKWFIIIASVLIVIAVILIVQLAKKEKEDIVLMYAGPQYIDKVTYEKITEVFTQITPDYNNDNKKVFNFSNTVYQTPEQRENKDNIYEKINADKANLDALQGFQNQVLSGQIVIYLLDPNFYEMYKGQLVKISDLTDKEIDAELMYGESGIYFKRTEFAKHFDCFEKLPDDTIMCIMTKLVTTDETLQKNSENFFNIILDFE